MHPLQEGEKASSGFDRLNTNRPRFLKALGHRRSPSNLRLILRPAQLYVNERRTHRGEPLAHPRGEVLRAAQLLISPQTEDAPYQGSTWTVCPFPRHLGRIALARVVEIDGNSVALRGQIGPASFCLLSPVS
jgi:hypothetical protein